MLLRRAGGIDGHPTREAMLSSPSGIAIDSAGFIFIADSGNHRIRMLSADRTALTTLAGSFFGFKDGLGNTARFQNPRSLALDGNGNIIVCDTRYALSHSSCRDATKLTKMLIGNSSIIAGTLLQ